MHPLAKRILWRAVPAAVFLGVVGYLMGRMLEHVTQIYQDDNVKIVGTDSPSLRGPPIFAGLAFVLTALMEWSAWRRERAAAAKKADAAPPPSTRE
jgi:hypothetical protein